MSFTIPTDLKEIVLYWWKIVDRPSITMDELYNFIAFDLFLTTLEKTKKLVHQAIKLGFLIENKEKEEVKLSNELEEQFNQWQMTSHEKIRKMQGILNQSWRENLMIDENKKFTVFLNDLMDFSVINHANKMLSSAIKIESLDFQSSIKGQAKDTNENNEIVFYSFEFLPEQRKIFHTCPEYQNKWKGRKQFCSHLGRLLIKLDVKDKTQTTKLMEDLVHNREKWIFK